jgi:hypothetical protein
MNSLIKILKFLQKGTLYYCVVVLILWFFYDLYGNDTWSRTEAIAQSDGFGKPVEIN